MAVVTDNSVLFKAKYENLIRVGYEQKGMLRHLVLNSGDVTGKSRSFPLMGLQRTYQRFGGELIQPSQPVTAEVLMTFELWESTESLPYIEVPKMDNPDYIPRIVKQQTNAISSRIEQIIINAFAAAPTVDANATIPTNIENGYRINGDGSAYTNAGAEQVLDLEGMSTVKTFFDDMGVEEQDRFMYIPSNAWKGLAFGADADRFTNRFYSDATNLALRGIKYDNLFGINLIVAQVNPILGLPASGAGTYGFAFIPDTVQLNISENGPGAKMWFENIYDSWMFRAFANLGAAAIRPSSLIKIACKTFT